MDYRGTITDSKGCSKIGWRFYRINVGHIGASTNQEDDYMIFPNPVKDILTIISMNKKDIDGLEIVNSFGQVIHSIVPTQSTIDVSNLPIGSYFIRCYKDGKSTSYTFMKS